MAKKVIKLNPKKNDLENNKDNYSNIIQKITQTFDKDFEQDADLYDRVAFTCNAWNMACMSEIIPEEKFDEIISLSELPRDLMLLMQKIIDYKGKHFPNHKQFIDEFDIKEEKGGYVLEVSIADAETYLQQMMEEQYENDYSDFDFEEGYIDRIALIVKPLQPYLDWTNNLFSTSSAKHKLKDLNTYLISDEVEEIDAWLKRNFDKIFNNELAEWDQDEKKWPAARTYQLFKKWFEVSMSSMVFDFEMEPIKK